MKIKTLFFQSKFMLKTLLIKLDSNISCVLGAFTWVIIFFDTNFASRTQTDPLDTLEEASKLHSIDGQLLGWLTLPQRLPVHRIRRFECLAKPTTGTLPSSEAVNWLTGLLKLKWAYPTFECWGENVGFLVNFLCLSANHLHGWVCCK